MMLADRQTRMLMILEDLVHENNNQMDKESLFTNIEVRNLYRYFY